ncbi:MAG TPA: carboxylesterase/lipase family protein [Acidimicrobiales bacterium]|nr:carboxylesterase/lipase family protein [Acidimicrobiales bacterium]
MDRVVVTTTGQVRGTAHDGCEVYLGIPYAEPPFGPNLLRPPQPRRPWDGVRDCVEFGPHCPQPDALAIMPRPVGPGEDCLSLNVWAPPGGERLPVMVWIHGGAYIYGSGADEGTDGRAFARDGVILVTINYRLGALGFLHAGSLDDRYAEASGNYGLADQIAALRWVQDNIANFGGDPGNVTIFGCSAGGTYVSTLLGCPAAQGLFAKVISQSAGGAPLFGFSPDLAVPVAQIVLDKLGVPTADLPSVPYKRIVDAQVELLAEINRGERDDVFGEQSIPFVPLVGGDLLPSAAIDAVGAGVGADVDLVIGTCRDEMTTFELMAEMTGSSVGVAARPWGAAADIQQRINGVYDATQEPDSPIAVSTSISTDRLFRVPSLRLADAHVAAGGSTRVYMFGWRSPAFGGRVGASHGLECPFVFDNFGSPMMSMMLGGEPPQGLAAAVHGSWAAFAKTGDPAATGAVASWPAYDTETRMTMVFDETSAAVPDPHGERRRVWDGVDVAL